MGLLHKALIALLVTSLMTLAGLLAARQWLVVPELERLEAEADKRDAQAVMLGFDMLIDNLARFAYDYAVWDDTYQFIEDGNQAYLDSNIVPTTFESLDIHLALLVDNIGRVRLNRVYDAEDGSLEPLELTPFYGLIDWLQEQGIDFKD